MQEELNRQRIKYLIEHGGLLDDPLADIRRDVKLAVRLALGACGISLLQTAATTLLHMH